jgi:hypothetical protein
MLRLIRPLRGMTAVLLALVSLVAPSHATWSILLVNTKTGEIGIAGATCLEGLDLAKALAVVRVGVGAGVAQGQIDSSGLDRIYMWDHLIAGEKPVDILADLKVSASGAGTKQWGLVNLAHAPAMWSGGGLGKAFAGSTGITGDFRYAVQGNVITGPEVVLAAATALLTTQGDLSQKLMAGMEAARALGGDGRCSCSLFNPTACGVPPPGFAKSAHVGFAIVARIGDVDGACSKTTGCANGSYYMDLAFSGIAGDPDPVLAMQADYALWRAGLAGHPDQLLSTAAAGPSLVADGVTTRSAVITLVDVDGNKITHGGATITVTPAPGTTAGASPGTPAYVGGGKYEIPFTAGTAAGIDQFALQVDDGSVVVTLYPYLTVKTDPLADLHVGVKSVSAGVDSDTPFVVNLGAGTGGHPFVLLGSVSGTAPGIPLGGGAVLPLNEDWFLHTTLVKAGSAALPGSIGVLDASGRAQASLVLPAGSLGPLVGLSIDWAAVDYVGPLAPTGSVGFDVVP